MRKSASGRTSQQELSINDAVASAAAAMLMKMLVTQDIHYHCTFVSLDTGTQFADNSPRILRKYLKALT